MVRDCARRRRSVSGNISINARKMLLILLDSGIFSSTSVPVWTVTMMFCVPPSAPTVGVTVQMLLAGAPVQVKATLPESVLRELSSSE